MSGRLRATELGIYGYEDCGEAQGLEGDCGGICQVYLIFVFVFGC